MVPAGYLLKRLSSPPEWLGVAHIVDVCSVSSCVNEDVADVQGAWRQNGFGVASDPATLWRLAKEQGEDAAGAALFYYEAFEQEIESDGWIFDPEHWRPLTPGKSWTMDQCAPPRAPWTARLLGYDVVVFEDDFLHHSPLSCNSVAQSLPVNEHCLMDSAESAQKAISSGGFSGGCEGGVYRIFSVSLVADGVET